MPLGSTRNNKGVRNPFFGKHHSEETKEKIHLAKIGVPVHSEEEKERRSIRFRGSGNPFYGKHHSPQMIEIIRARTPRLTGKNSPNFGRVNSEFARQRSREANTGPLNPNWGGMTDSHRKKILQSLKSLPTKPEKHLLAIIERLSLPFRYVGNGEVFIARKCPDFINYNGAKQIIELAGRHWHTEEELKERAKLFAKYGFSTLIIWDDELQNESSVEGKLLNFTNKEVN
jgi:very-short-patch-repair endonuclease